MALRAGETIRIGNKVYEVRHVGESRAFCVPINPPKTGDAADADIEAAAAEDLPVKQRDKGINISPNAVVERVDSHGRSLGTAWETTVGPRDHLPEPDPRAVPLPHSRVEKIDMAKVASIPVQEKSARQLDKERREKQAQRARANAEAGIGSKGPGRLAQANAKTSKPPLRGAAAAARAKAAANGGVKKEKAKNACLCGCGELTGGYFAMGHDSKFKSWMTQVERGTMAVSDLPKSVQKAYEFKKVGKGFRTTKNYKGESHQGYDTAAR